MSETDNFVAGGLVMLVAGVFLLLNYKIMSQHSAKQSREWSARFKFNYSEQFFFYFYRFIGVLFSLGGLLVLLGGFLH